MKHIKYPTYQIEIGRSLMLNRQTEEILNHAKEMLVANYEETRKRVERDGDRVFCEMGPLEMIVRIDEAGIWNSMSTVSWKATVAGRAFYVKRLECLQKPYKLHPNKKNVPKRKRGKRVCMTEWRMPNRWK